MSERPSPDCDAPVEHRISTHGTAFGYGWGCSCGRQGSSHFAPTPEAAYAYGSKHVVTARKAAKR